jgi:hypothetical protein
MARGGGNGRNAMLKMEQTRREISEVPSRSFRGYGGLYDLDWIAGQREEGAWAWKRRLCTTSSSSSTWYRYLFVLAAHLVRVLQLQEGGQSRTHGAGTDFSGCRVALTGVDGIPTVVKARGCGPVG